MTTSLKHCTYRLPEGDIVFSYVYPIPEVVYDRYEDDRARGLSSARGAMVKAVIRSHTGVQLDAIFERHPAVKHGLAIIIQKDAGAMADIVEGEVSAS